MAIFRGISPNLVALAASYDIVVEDRRIMSTTKMQSKQSSF